MFALTEVLFHQLNHVPYVFLVGLVVSAGGIFLLLPLLKRWKWGQRVRDQGPERHLSKAGTPTMAGIGIFLAAGVLVLLLPKVAEIGALFAAVGAAFALGFWDDYLKVILDRPLGIRARNKLGIQFLLGLVLGIWAVEGFGLSTELVIPGFSAVIDVGRAYPLFSALLVAATANAVNLTDGLDGLAGGGVAISLAFFVWVGLLQQQLPISLFSAGLMGACVGFLYHNIFPARAFMGDTGSLTLGTLLAGLAIFTKTELFLVLVGGLFVIETLSVMIQVVYFRISRGRRLLLMSPLHHHFELKGWHEKRVVQVFWLFHLLCVGAAFWGYRGVLL